VINSIKITTWIIFPAYPVFRWYNS